MDNVKTPFLLFLGVSIVAGPGCKLELGLDAIGAGDQGDEETDSGDDEPIPEPESGSPQTEFSPLIPGAVWSLTWFTSEPIRAADLGDAGLALAGASDCALIDPSNGYPIWNAPELDGGRGSEVWTGPVGLVWARALDAAVWELRTHELDGALADTSVVPYSGNDLAFTDDGALILALEQRFVALDQAGDELWSRDADPDHLPYLVSPTAGGVLAIEARPGLDDYHFEYRLLELDAGGSELAVTGYDAVAMLPDALVKLDDRLIVADSFPLGGARVLGVEPEFLGVAWTLDFDGSIEIAPGPDGGALVLAASPDAPAELLTVDVEGEIVDSRQASAGGILFPILAVGEAGEVIVGGRRSDGILELHRLD